MGLWLPPERIERSRVIVGGRRKNPVRIRRRYGWSRSLAQHAEDDRRRAHGTLVPGAATKPARRPFWVVGGVRSIVCGRHAYGRELYRLGQVRMKGQTPAKSVATRRKKD